MKLTIITDDGAVYKNGVSYSKLNLTGIPLNIHALQFNAELNSGWLEYNDGKANLTIDVLPDWAIAAELLFDTKFEADEQAKNQPVSFEVLLETAKFQKIDAINSARDIEIGKGVYFDSVLYDSNDEARANMVFKLNAMEPNSTVSWRAKNNTIVELSYAQLENLIRSVDSYVQQQYEKSWGYKNTIFSATTVEEVNSVVWN